MDTQPGRILALLTAIALLAACGGGGHGDRATPPASSPPVASFTATPASGAVPLTVQFDASASSDPGGSIASYAWNFGDDTAAGAGVAVSHVYPTGGVFTVTLMVTDNVGATGSVTRQITVTSTTVPLLVGQTQGAAETAILAAGLTVGAVTGATNTTVPAGSVISQNPVAGTAATPDSAVSLVVSTGVSGTNLPPAASFTATPEVSTFPLTVLFNASASHDSDGSIASYSWNFGDDTATGSGAHISHVYQTAGTFTTTLTVTDNLGATATHSVQFTQLPIQVELDVESYQVEGLVGDSVPVVAYVLATYEVRDVVATLAGRQTALTRDPESTTFRGTLSLAGEPYGSYTLSVRATDVRGNVDDDSIVVVHDNPPVLTVLKPLDQSVALGTLPVDLRCTDDLPGCVVEVWSRRNIDRPTLLAEAPTALATTVDLTESIGNPVWLALRSRDSSGQVTERNVRVNVESPARLAIVAEVPGAIIDADTTRLLFMESQATGDRLAIYDRATSLTEIIAGDFYCCSSSYSYLTPSGAIFLAATKGENPIERLHVWRQGTLTEIPESSMFWSFSLDVSGDYAIWSGGTNNGDDNLYRVNTATGVVTLVSTDAWSAGSVAADGTVAFSSRSTYQIVRDRDGQQTVLTNDPSHWHIAPLIDGDQILYLRTDPSGEYQRRSIVLIEGTDLIPLTYSRTTVTKPMDDYQLNGGWAAYTELDTQYQLQVDTLSPQGAVTRHTDFSTSSRIDRLGGTGEVMIINGKKRYFSRGLGPAEVSSAAGKAYWLNGAWYVAIGTTLLAVDTSN